MGDFWQSKQLVETEERPNLQRPQWAHGGNSGGDDFEWYGCHNVPLHPAGSSIIPKDLVSFHNEVIIVIVRQECGLDDNVGQ